MLKLFSKLHWLGGSAIGALSALALTASAPGQVPDDGADLWRADADAFFAVLLAEHDNPFFLTPEADYRAALNAYKADVGAMSRAERIAGLAHLAALVGDGHTWMPMHALPFDGLPPGPGFSSLPVRFELFNDGLYVVGATDAHANLVGARVESIGGVPAPVAISRALDLLPNDAINFASEFVAEWLMQAELLVALGLATNADEVELGLDQNGEARQIRLAPLGAQYHYDWVFSMDSGPVGPAGPSGWHTAAAATPLWQETVVGNWRTLDLGDAIYLQIINIRDGADQSYAAMAAAAVSRAETLTHPGLIIDLRRCLGGDGTLNPGLIDALAGSEVVNQAGRLMILTSRETHSAAVMLVSALEQRTAARFIGQATADRPNHYGETNIFVTPNSQLPIIHASEYYQTSTPDDDRPFRTPDIAIPYNFSDYALGADPVLATALHEIEG